MRPCFQSLRLSKRCAEYRSCPQLRLPAHVVLAVANLGAVGRPALSHPKVPYKAGSVQSIALFCYPKYSSRVAPRRGPGGTQGNPP
jgi:hypothetical protein